LGNTKSDLLRSTAVWALRIVAILLLIGTASSLTEANQWWIRIWDFPRTQILIVLLVTAVLLYSLDEKWRPWLPIVILLGASWQFYRVYPYTGLAAMEVSRTTAGEEVEQGCFKVVTFNVLQTNRDYASTLDMLEREDADVLLLLETDDGWRDAMMPQLSRYSTVLEKPLSNKYGLIFATRLPARAGQIVDLAEKDTPSAFITLTVGESDFYLMALHPRPPHPGRDTEERDAELVMAARRAAEVRIPVLAIGDFNDVAWSKTSQLFKQIGEFLDPRIGRGTYATFPANMTWLGWPLDHLFMTKEFLVSELQVLENVGSDHRPVSSRLCLAPAVAERRNEDTDAATREEASEAAEVMEDYRRDSAEDAKNGE
jgi:endonuclease/exonuclease/phosphatase (EEP) superfamily protein YafD